MAQKIDNQEAPGQVVFDQPLEITAPLPGALPDTLEDPDEIDFDAEARAMVPIEGPMAQAGTPGGLAAPTTAPAQPTLEEIKSTPLIKRGEGEPEPNALLNFFEGAGDKIGEIIGDFTGKKPKPEDEKPEVKEKKKAEVKASKDNIKSEVPPRPDEKAEILPPGAEVITPSDIDDRMELAKDIQTRSALKLNTGDLEKLRPSFTGLNQQKKAVDLLADTEEQYQFNLSNIMSSPSGENLAKADAKLIKEIALRKTFLDDQITEFKTAMQDAKKEEFKYDFWGEKSTGQKIAMAIALGLGGASEGLTGRKNPVIAVLDKIMDRDLAKAKFKYSSRQDQRTKKLMYLQNIGKNMDAKVASDMATKAIYLEQVKREIDRQTAKRNTQKARVNADMLKGQITEKQNLLSQAANVQIAKAANERLKAGVAKNVIPGDLLAKYPGAASDIPSYMLSEEDRARRVPGLGFAHDKQSAVQMREKLSNKRDMVKWLKELREIRRGNEWDSPFGIMTPSHRKALNEAQSLAKRLIVAGNVQAGLGALSGPDMSILTGYLGDPESILDWKMNTSEGIDPIDAQLEQAIDLVEGSFKNHAMTQMDVYNPSVTETSGERSQRAKQQREKAGKR
jgi:hypothetical protein